jgi:cytochrome b6-f complex iron-sulfur subunit
MSESTMPSPSATRREFCTRACQAASLAAIGSLVGAACGDGPTAPSSGANAPAIPVINAAVSGRVVSVPLAGSPLATSGSAALLQTSIGAFVAARIAENSANVFTAVCTHQSCTVSGFQNNRFVCPCHGSQFTTGGSVANGPATRGLQQFTATVADGVLSFTA